MQLAKIPHTHQTTPPATRAASADQHGTHRGRNRYHPSTHTTKDEAPGRVGTLTGTITNPTYQALVHTSYMQQLAQEIIYAIGGLLHAWEGHRHRHFHRRAGLHGNATPHRACSVQREGVEALSRRCLHLLSGVHVHSKHRSHSAQVKPEERR